MMKLFTQILILVGLLVITVEATTQVDKGHFLNSDKGLFLDPSEVNFPAESDYLMIPDGRQRGAVISKAKLRTAISERFEDIVEIYDISIVDELYFREGLGRLLTFGLADIRDFDNLTISFKIKNTDSDTDFHPEIQCIAHNHNLNDDYLYLESCKSENVKVTQKEIIEIPMSDISVSFEEYHTERTAN